MLIRTVVLLLLCVSTGMCATLVSFHSQGKEKEKEELIEKSVAAVADAVVAATDAEAAVEGEAAAVDQVGDPPAAEKPVGNTLFSNKLLQKIFAVDNPEADKLKENEAEEPGNDSERSAGVPPAVEAPIVIQEVPSSAEEGNEIKPVKTNRSSRRPLVKQDNNTWSLNSIRDSFQTMHGYFDSLVELVGGHNGVCQYRCRYGEVPQPRPGYQSPQPNGCSSSLVGFQVNAALDLGIPAMTQCCNQLDMCYDTCGTSKSDCDSQFRSCLHGICSNLKKSLGFVSQVQACDSVADVLYNTVWTLGCRPYMNSQRAACVCDGEERDEL